MEVAITADVHLTEKARHPQRLAALEEILNTLCERGIEHLIVAGDLFDASQRNYAEFEALCTRPEYASVQLTIIPGNHDAELRGAHVSAANVRVLDEPAPVTFAQDARPFLFIPYKQGQTMGEAIAPFASQLPADEWVLVGHGDWAGGARAGNPYEPGVYMPLTRSDVQRFRPATIFLGHIHIPIDRPPLYYAGSPCGLDITETGHRRFLRYDLTSGGVSSTRIEAPVLYFDETFVVVPADDEAEFMRRQIEERIASWQLEPGDEDRVRLRVRISGYSANKRALADVVSSAFDRYQFYKQDKPDLSEVHVADDLELAAIAEQVRQKIETLAWPQEGDEPTPDEIMLEALHVIYEES
ncbi:MAG TPA: metallophosphoesterase [Candidatus Sulfomarinibacteraceae bacterium]|nr:metallophosphoesterase [Candidatus Sulfomarinibacteraceae bacterium]